MDMIGSVLGMTGTGEGDEGRSGQGTSTGGPAIRTFRFGTPGGGGMVAGGSISFGGPSRLARGPDGRFPLMGSPDEERSNLDNDGGPPDRGANRNRNDPARQEADDLGDILTGLMGGGSMHRVGGRGDGPAVFTNARPAGMTPNRPDTLEGMLQAMMLHMMHPQDDEVPWFMQGAGLGGGDRGRLGDYVYTQG